MKNSQKYFENTECRHFPCHTLPEGDSSDGFNCLFCFCPLYALGELCGGNFSFDNENGVKSCVGCDLPHRPEYYGTVMAKLKKAAKKGREAP